MTVIFSKTCEYSLQIVLYLSIKPEMRYTATEVSEELKMPKENVAKILQMLTDSGIIGSKKGRGGGFFLARKPSEIRLIDVVEAIDGFKLFQSCVLGFPGCSDTDPCPVHNKWGKLRDEAFKMLSMENLEALKSVTAGKLKMKIDEGDKVD
ncbi:MAG: Rrf2 family transcriptional regulator [Ignavibacteriaceae bacterium]|nr:Rrf2 family transcriptional regulator [Ignavibacteriaceae bacterium]